MGPIAGVIGAIASVVGTVASISAAQKAARARQRQETLTRRRSARQAIREAQIRRAQAVATAQGAGALSTSGAQGGIGSLTSQLGERLGYSSQYSNLSQDITRYQTQSEMFSGIASLGGSIFNAADGFSSFNTSSSSVPSFNNTSPWTPNG